MNAAIRGECWSSLSAGYFDTLQIIICLTASWLVNTTLQPNLNYDFFLRDIAQTNRPE